MTAHKRRPVRQGSHSDGLPELHCLSYRRMTGCVCEQGAFDVALSGCGFDARVSVCERCIAFNCKEANELQKAV